MGMQAVCHRVTWKRQGKWGRRGLQGAALALAGLTMLAFAPAANAQAACSARGKQCYDWHQCWINYCAGYQVNCNAYANTCGHTCYRYWSTYLQRQYGPLPKYCVRR